MTSPPRRIVLLTPTVTGADGISCLARQVAGALVEMTPHGRVEVWTLSEPALRADVLGPRISVHGSGGRRLRYVARALAASRRDWDGALVVVLHVHLLPAAWPLVARGACLVPVLVGIEAWRALGPLRRRMLARVPRAMAISAHTAREFARANPDLAALPVDVCHPAVPPLASPGRSPVDRDPPFALIVGRMSRDERYKGHDLLIDIWPDVCAQAPDARLVVAGGGDDQSRLADRAAGAGLGGAITFTGPVPDDELAALYQDCAFFVLPSLHEGFGLVLLEAMSRGKACIGGVGAASEIIDHGQTGLIVTPARPREVTDALVTLFTDEAGRARLGAAGLARTRTDFAAARFARDLAAAVERACPVATSASC